MPVLGCRMHAVGDVQPLLGRRRGAANHFERLRPILLLFLQLSEASQLDRRREGRLRSSFSAPMSRGVDFGLDQIAKAA